MPLVRDGPFEKASGGAPTQQTKFGVAVVFTSVRATIAALQRAAVLARGLHAQVTLVVPQIVPYPLPVTSPPVLTEFNERRFRRIGVRAKTEMTVRIYLCSDRDDLLNAVLPPHSVIVIGGRRGRWRSKAEERLARTLSTRGYEVIYTETE